MYVKTRMVDKLEKLDCSSSCSKLSRCSSSDNIDHRSLYGRRDPTVQHRPSRFLVCFWCRFDSTALLAVALFP